MVERMSDDESKEQYREYEEIEGIVIDRNNIVRNSGLSSVAKFCLNSFLNSNQFA